MKVPLIIAVFLISAASSSLATSIFDAAASKLNVDAENLEQTIDQNGRKSVFLRHLGGQSVSDDETVTTSANSKKLLSNLRSASIKGRNKLQRSFLPRSEEIPESDVGFVEVFTHDGSLHPKLPVGADPKQIFQTICFIAFDYGQLSYMRDPGAYNRMRLNVGTGMAGIQSCSTSNPSELGHQLSQLKDICERAANLPSAFSIKELPPYGLGFGDQSEPICVTRPAQAS